jgi:hypothetical protein
MQEAVAWNKNQQARVQSYKPQNPELPTDFACPPGQCTTEPPPPPVGLEGFQSSSSTYWISTMLLSTLVFLVLTRAF